LPEKIETADTYTEELIYEETLDGGEKLYGWYFEAHIRQSMDYTEFPFDHKKIELRLLPKQWQSNAVLVPDFDSYLKKDLLADSFGIDERIILDGYDWQIHILIICGSPTILILASPIMWGLRNFQS